MDKRKKFLECIRMVTGVWGMLILFYRNLLLVLLFGIPLILWEYRNLKRQWEKKRRWQLNLEFKEGLQGMAAALSAGYSIENALEESRRDLAVLYGDNSVLSQEFQVMQRQLDLNQPIEAVFEEFARRSRVEDIRSFAEIFRTAKRSGGDLVAITRTTADRIGEKIEVKREIRTILAGKEMEGKIMNLVPLGMIFYFWICSPGFLDCLYQTIWGRAVMTILLCIYLAALGMSRKICSISL